MDCEAIRNATLSIYTYSCCPYASRHIPGRRKALSKTGNRPPTNSDSLKFLIVFPTSRVSAAAARVTRLPRIMSRMAPPASQLAIRHPINRAGTASGNTSGSIVKASDGRNWISEIATEAVT